MLVTSSHERRLAPLTARVWLMTLSPHHSPGPAPTLVSIGNIHVTAEHVITPAGSWPLKDVNVTTVDQTHTTSHTPTWAVVMVIIFIWFFLLSLLFLLARETRTSGYIAVHIQAGTQSYTEQVPILSARQRGEVFNRVAFFQSLIGRARQYNLS